MLQAILALCDGVSPHPLLLALSEVPNSLLVAFTMDQEGLAVPALAIAIRSFLLAAACLLVAICRRRASDTAGRLLP